MTPSFIESKQREHTRNTFFPLPGHSVLWGNGEFLCPLCQSFSNTVLPLLLPLPAPRSPSPTPPPPSSSSSQPLSFPQWRELVAMATDLADSDIKEQGIAFFFTGAHVVMLYHCFFYVVEYMYVGQFMRSLLCLNLFSLFSFSVC